MTNKILLLIAAYLYRANHPTESQSQVMQGVVDDLALVKLALETMDKSGIE